MGVGVEVHLSARSSFTVRELSDSVSKIRLEQGHIAATIDATLSGWTFGTGIEYQLSPKWSAKAEYDYLDFGTNTVGTNLLVPGDSLATMVAVHEVKAGVNYHWR